MKTTSLFAIFLSSLPSIAQSATCKPPRPTECKTTRTFTSTYDNGGVEENTFISPCTPVPTAELAAGEEPGWDPYTQTQITARYVPATGTAEPEPTTVTNIWVHYPDGKPYARLDDLRPNCNCTSTAASDTEADSCANQGMRTKCSVQCGRHEGQFVCLADSTNENDFLEGRICVADLENGQEIEYLGEPCHVGDVMNDCSLCFSED